MNCCNNKDNSGSNGQHKMKHISHKVMMVLCCGAPLLILLFLPVISSYLSPNARNLLITIVPFICPIMMFFMMPMMKERGDRQQTTQDEFIEINNDK